MKMIRVLILLISISIVGYAQSVSNIGTTAAQFLKVDISARSAAMGSASTVSVNDVTAIFSNPAALSKIEDHNEIYFSHINWFLDIGIDFGAVALPISGIGTVGIFVTALNMGEIDVRTVFEPEGTGEKYSASDLSMGLSFARNITDRFSFGLNFKYIHQQIWKTSASAVAFDFGTMYCTSYKDLRFGISMNNFGTPLQLDGTNLEFTITDYDPTQEGETDRVIGKYKTDEWALPLNFRLGFAIDPIVTEKNILTLSVDAVQPSDNEQYINSGFEYGFMQTFFLRSGYRGLGISSSEGGLSAGVGFKYALTNMTKIKLDYTYVDFGRLEDVQYISASILF